MVSLAAEGTSTPGNDEIASADGGKDDDDDYDPDKEGEFVEPEVQATFEAVDEPTAAVNEPTVAVDAPQVGHAAHSIAIADDASGSRRGGAAGR